MPRRETDRNLLFGILALQMDFITRDALVAGMKAWVLEKDRPLGEILVDRKALDASDRAMLEPMVDRHVARHDDDPTASLATVSSMGSLADELRRSVTDEDVFDSLATLIPSDDPYATRAETVETSVSRLTSGFSSQPDLRYRKVREHARGGLGVVFVARDGELNRDVALKEIKDNHADNDEHRAKFLLEAEVTGGLEHPGIVPVYGLGHHDDGRPFYAMKFIKGDSLMEAITGFHGNELLQSDPGERNLALQKLLRRFTDVCNAIGYAHSRGVLHRDLKPHNVMVGKYGETLVVDWGLAKTTGQSGESDHEGGSFQTQPEETLRLSSGTTSATDTLPGRPVGTPAYMSPEQAAGRLDLLGPLSDVYGLGATLYHLLAGRSPFSGKDLYQLLENVKAGHFPRPREAASWLDPALEAIALKAMALNPEARYPTPRALAEDVERWVAGEPVIAYREPFLRRARRWAKRHRTALSIGSTAATVAAILLGGFAWQRISQRQRTDASALAVLDQADRLAVEARSGSDLSVWIRAVDEARRAVSQLESGGGSDPLRRLASSRYEDLKAEEGGRREDLRIVADLDEARLRGADVKDDHFDDQAKVDAYIEAFRAYRIDVETLPIDEAARRIRSSKIADALIAALDDWVFFSRTEVSTKRLAAITRGAETDPTRAAIREAVAKRDSARLQSLSGSEQDRKKLGAHLRFVFKSLLVIDPAGSLPLLESILRENPSDFWLYHDLGQTYKESKPSKPNEALRCLTVAVALRPSSPGAHLHLGNALLVLKKRDEAIAEYRVAIRLKHEIAEAHSNLGGALRDQGRLDEALQACLEALRIRPRSVGAHVNIGFVRDAQGRTDEAIAEYREAIKIDPNYALAYANIAVCLDQQGKLDEAVSACREALRINPEFADAYCNLGYSLYRQDKLGEALEASREAIRINPEHADAYSNLGSILKAQGKLDEAVSACREALRINPDLTTGHVNLGNALKDQKKFDQAIAEYREAIRINPTYALAHSNLGVVLREQGKLDESIAEHREALKIKPGFSEPHLNMGNALHAQGKLDLAIAEYREALRINPNYFEAHHNLATCLSDQGKLDLAIAEYREALRINPRYFQALLDLGNTLNAQGKADEAIVQYHELIRIKPDFADPHYNLGVTLNAQGKPDEAIAEYREAIKIRRNYPDAHNNLGLILSSRGQFDQAIAEYRETIRLKPDHAGAYCNLGLALGAQGLFAESLENLKRGHEIGSRQPGWRDPSAAWVEDARRLVEMEARLPAILRGETSPQNSLERLSLAEMCYKKGLPASSARFYDEAFTEQPTLADDLAKSHRYNASCAASLAGSGSGKDDPAPDDPAKVKLRGKALGWLKADLTAWSKVLDAGNEPIRKQVVVMTLAHWKEDSDLAGIRDRETLGKLPEAERAAFQELWRDVEALRKKATEK